MTANHAQMHLGRRDMARELAQKLTGQQELAEAELRRCEGAMGVLAQMQEAAGKQRAAFEANKSSLCPDDPTDEQIRTSLDVKIAVEECIDEVEGGYRNLKTAAELNMVALRGRIAMVETALDLCEAAFGQESEALQEVLKAVAEEQQGEKNLQAIDHINDALRDKRKADRAAKNAKQRERRAARAKGKHPGPPVARTRKAGGVKK